jgi:hypothetical protein
MRPFFCELRLETECAVVMLIYVDLLMSKSMIVLRTSNWRPVLYTALLLATKIWEDLGCQNADFTTFYPLISLAALNRLEVLFTDSVDWNFFIDPETYMRYYYSLKEMSTRSPTLKALARGRFDKRPRLG